MSIYLDNSATTPVRQEVIEAMLPYLKEHWGNASSIHAAGRTAKKAIDSAREQVASLLNCQPEEVHFSACGTVSNNLALLGRARFLEANGRGKHLITSQIEHPSVSGPAKYLESQGWRVTYLPVTREGFVEVDQLKAAISPDTSIISIIWANNEIGTVEPVQALSEIAADKEIFFHTDAVQVPGKLPIDLKSVKVSALSLSGHKFYAPKGIGILFLRKGENLMPIEFGGGQERGMLPGTEAVANIVAIGKAAQLAKEELAVNQSKLLALQTGLIERLASVPDLQITGSHDPKRRLPGHVSFVIPEVEGETIVLKCDLQGLCLSSGSACHQGVIEPSLVLKAIGLSHSQAMGSVRVSFGKFNTSEDGQVLSEKLSNILLSLRKGNKAAAGLSKS
jgi:cysteine desulfurase